MSEMVSLGAPAAPVEEAGFDFAGFFWRRAWLFIFFGLIGGVLGYFYYLKQPIRYASSAEVLVIKQQADMGMQNVNGFDPSGNRDPLANDTRMIMSPLVVGPAVENGLLAQLPSLVGVSDPVQSVLRDLTVNRSNADASVLTISYRGSDADDCGKIVNAVVESYNSKLKEAYIDVGTVTGNLLRTAKEEYEEKRQQSQSKHDEFRRTLTGLLDGDNVVSVHQTRMHDIENARSKLNIEQTEIRSQLEAVNKAMRNGGSREAVMLLVESMTAGDKDSEASPTNSAVTAARELFPLMLQRQIALENVGADHPSVKMLDTQIKLTREFLSEQAGALVKDGEAPKVPKDFLELYIESLSLQLQAGDENGKQLDAQFDKESNSAKTQIDLVSQDRLLKNEIARNEAMFNTLVDKLKNVDLASKGGDYRAEVLTPAVRGTQYEPLLKTTLIMGSVLGILLGMLLGFMVEAVDKSFRSPDEVGQTLGLPIIGASPMFQFQRDPKRDDGVSPNVVAIHRPRSQSAESFRGMRSHLLALAKGEDHRVILVTSPEPGDGKSTMSANLAVAMAQTGKSVLLIDADMRRPTIHKLFGIEKEHQGLTELLQAEAEFDALIHSYPVEGGELAVLGAGHCPKSPGELLMGEKFANLLDMLRDRYDWVIIDSPPVLAVTDSTTIARQVDGVLLVVRLASRSRLAAIRASEILRSLNAKVLGVLVNGVDPTRGGSYGYVYGASSRSSKYYADSYGS